MHDVQVPEFMCGDVNIPWLNFPLLCHHYHAVDVSVTLSAPPLHATRPLPLPQGPLPTLGMNRYALSKSSAHSLCHI